MNRIIQRTRRRAPGAPPGRTRTAALAVCVLAAVRMLCATGTIEPDFQNRWHTNGLDVSGWTNQSAWASFVPHETAMYGGHIYSNGWSSGVRVSYVAFGHPVETRTADFKFGEVITPPRGVDRSRAPTIIPDTTAFYAPSAQRVYAADAGNVKIDWVLHDGGTATRVYKISPIPVSVPSRIFWTEEPHDSPPVELNGKYITIHHNSRIGPPGLTNDNGIVKLEQGLWLDSQSGQKLLKAMDCRGLVLVEFFQTAFKENHLGVEIVEVLPPSVVVQNVDVCDRLRPDCLLYGDEGLIPHVIAGAGEFGATPLLYHHTTTEGGSPKEDWVFAVGHTVSRPWELKIYWKHEGLLGVEWPYEVAEYEAGWPADAQLYVRSAATDAAGDPRVLIPEGLDIGLPGFGTKVAYQEPAAHADFAADGRSFSSESEGHAVLGFTSEDDVWLMCVRSVRHDDETVFDLTPANWAIGRELTYEDEIYEEAWMDFPGYVHDPAGTAPYNVDLYDYPTPTAPDTPSYVFGVNKGTLEVWWANPTFDEYIGENTVIHWPARVVRYSNAWPTNALELPIAGNNNNEDNTLPDYCANPLVYVQNDPTSPGYNPNEEHAIILANQVYPIRCDLNEAGSSEPRVLVQYNNGNRDNHPEMRVYNVVVTNAAYPEFLFPLEAGTLVQAPMPLTILPRCENSAYVSGPGWRDRKLDFWARAAGDDGISTADIVMHYYYPVQPGFFFPELGEDQLAGGTEVPFLNYQPDKPQVGPPIDVVYEIRWPDDTPKLHIAETLVKPKRGLPSIDGQLSVEIVYEQSFTNSRQHSVTLIDPTRTRSAALAGGIPNDVQSELATDGKFYFPTLPPHLRERLFYNPAAGTLNFRGEFVEPALGEPYLMLNYLTGENRTTVRGLSTSTDWGQAVDTLATSIVVVGPEDPFDSLALSAGLGTGSGYVTLAMQNSTNLCNPADPVSLAVIRVDTNLYEGEIKVIAGDNPLSELLTMRHSGDFAGHADTYEFEWRTLPPQGGLPPTNPYDQWILHAKDNGKLYTVIGGPGLLTLSDNYFVCRYRPTDTNCPAGTTTWSEWTDPMLAEGWIKRALRGINPFDQRIRDLANNQIHSLVSMISQAGQRWEGDVPLNLSGVNDSGLIEIYETILHRGMMLSVDAGYNYQPANDALLLAAGRLSDLYMLLGNEAYADAMDPTVGFGTTDHGIYGNVASSLFCFMNQVPDLLHEELALLRGRDDSLLPPVDTAPVYNRLVWNLTSDITGGEVAYMQSYNIQNANPGEDGDIDVDDARVAYPQGHGDAWGHYLTAIKGYYLLLGNTNFTWTPQIEAVLVGGAPVSVDYFDERQFAEAAEAKSRAGLDILDRTYRSVYEPDRTCRGDFYFDDNGDRAWGVAEWGSRVGMGAYFDWVVGNSLLPDKDTNVNHVGIQKVDRTTVAELGVLPTHAANAQATVDQADLGLNPLGLAGDALVFDIDPGAVTDGQTHFEQVYERARRALNNAHTVLDQAQQCSAYLRRQQDSEADLAQALTEQEGDYEGRLLDIFGYPYSDDIGPGKTYPDGYEGPDLMHFQYIDSPVLSDLLNAIGGSSFALTTTTITANVAGDHLGYNDENKIITTPEAVTVAFNISPLGLLIKPDAWTGSRRAVGKLQLAYSDFVQAYVHTLEAAADLDVQNRKVDRLAALVEDRIQTDSDIAAEEAGAGAEQGRWARVATMAEEISGRLGAMADFLDEQADASAEAPPGVVGMTANDVFSAIRAAAHLGGSAAGNVVRIAAMVAKSKAEKARARIKSIASESEATIAAMERGVLYETMIADLLDQADLQEPLMLHVQVCLERMNQTQGRYLALMAEGQRLMDERTLFRRKTATEIEQMRYKDMAFRIFRNDALRKYESAFDLAATYVYLAAKAYDYETALWNASGGTTPGAVFLSRVIQTHSLGSIADGEPQLGGLYGDPGLADIMARMRDNWTVLDGRLGFNNPETETSRFSLRTEFFRIGTPQTSDATWRAALWMHAVDDLKRIDTFKNHCLPFDDSTVPEPGIVIPFSSTIEFGRNFFGRALAGGDHAYDASHFATKIRSVGVWFSGYDNTRLANTPRVYLVPAGTDVMRSPTESGQRLRTWRVFDQALPLPHDLGAGDLSRTGWSAVTDSLSTRFAERRRFGSFRAYHDSGLFDDTEVCDASRLIGRSVWNTQWYLIVPAGTMHGNRDTAIQRFIEGPDGTNGVTDIKLFFQTYSYAGN
jgi:hypothetical protein